VNMYCKLHLNKVVMFSVLILSTMFYIPKLFRRVVGV
jgi:hypothetical protein